MRQNRLIINTLIFSTFYSLSNAAVLTKSSKDALVDAKGATELAAVGALIFTVGKTGLIIAQGSSKFVNKLQVRNSLKDAFKAKGLKLDSKQLDMLTERVITKADDPHALKDLKELKGSDVADVSNEYIAELKEGKYGGKETLSQMRKDYDGSTMSDTELRSDAEKKAYEAKSKIEVTKANNGEVTKVERPPSSTNINHSQPSSQPGHYYDKDYNDLGTDKPAEGAKYKGGEDGGYEVIEDI